MMMMMMGHFGGLARHPIAGGWHRVDFGWWNQYIDAAADAASCMPMLKLFSILRESPCNPESRSDSL